MTWLPIKSAPKDMSLVNFKRTRKPYWLPNFTWYRARMEYVCPYCFTKIIQDQETTRPDYPNCQCRNETMILLSVTPCEPKREKEVKIEHKLKRESTWKDTIKRWLGV